MSEVFDRLEEEYAAFDETLTSLSPEEWAHPTLCAGWDVRDLVTHLWIQAEVASATIRGDETFLPSSADELPELDARIDAAVRSRRNIPAKDTWGGWQDERAGVVDSLRTLDPAARVQWTVAPMAPTTLATMLMMEAWAHAYDVRAPLGAPQTVTPGLRDVAWFTWKTLPFAFYVAGETYEPVRFEVDSPTGETWRFGPDEASDVVRGSALELCLRGVRRLELDAAETLAADGPIAETALRVMRCYP